MATLSVIAAVPTGAIMTPVAAAGGGDQFLNTGREVLYVLNGDASPVTLTFAPGGLPGGLALATYNVVVAAGEERMIGPFPAALYSNPTGYVTITYSGVTSLEVAVVRVVT